jgi:2-polyprenyl-3-methyl-5-hydroxy-6-metoxy-1,4-benzoquinol methylase
MTVESRRQDTFWRQHYDALARKGTPWLDYGNERVQQQSLDLALRAAAPVHQRRCVDVGCGRGQLSLALVAEGAADVMGLDTSPALVASLQQSHPALRWLEYSLSQSAPASLRAMFDCVFAVEVLQYVQLRMGLQHLWDFAAPGGRLVGIVPNRDCPFLASAIARFDGFYAPPATHELIAELRMLSGTTNVTVQGMWYTQQPEGPPYRLGPTDAAGDPPNRLLWTATKSHL